MNHTHMGACNTLTVNQCSRENPVVEQAKLPARPPATGCTSTYNAEPSSPTCRLYWFPVFFLVLQTTPKQHPSSRGELHRQQGAGDAQGLRHAAGCPRGQCMTPLLGITNPSLLEEDLARKNTGVTEEDSTRRASSSIAEVPGRPLQRTGGQEDWAPSLGKEVVRLLQGGHCVYTTTASYQVLAGRAQPPTCAVSFQV
ncbi:hypothetical protein MAPG_12074 [Magnaporthiopsis poae ATCC 64411]|uniref:Uncharacterized protein n=1 Tax=Magnaporthiopsis poae (strain ATCC 64411 / 73-15) TaxID=644358 RepID=A0A0C4EGS5_MAGP6|nr:hypothetical protein MAPG_12074 [Magnaporthiopsis poae ATCC 64411]